MFPGEHGIRKPPGQLGRKTSVRCERVEMRAQQFKVPAILSPVLQMVVQDLLALLGGEVCDIDDHAGSFE